MLRHPSPGLIDVSRNFVCVRVADMRGVDLDVFRFDYGLTFATLLMHADGRIYHQYGNRTPAGADSHLSMASLERVMRATLTEHAAHVASRGAGAPRPPPPEVPETVERLPTMARRVAAGKAPDCFHCHMVFQARDEEAREKGTFDASVAWRWPPSTRIGLHLIRDDQQLVGSVAADSPAAAAGLRAGDRIVRLGERTVRTEGDVQWVLDELPGDGATVTARIERSGKARDIELTLPPGWRVGSPDELWRPTLWRLDPRPGFGGPLLTPEEKESRGIDADVSAFRIQYLVTWGDHARTGVNARKAGLRENDVVLSVGGRSDFRSVLHFHAWFRLTRTVGETVPIVILRKGEQRTIELPVIE